MRKAECGMRSFAFGIPHSALRIWIVLHFVGPASRLPNGCLRPWNARRQDARGERHETRATTRAGETEDLIVT